ncbi:MAG: thiamine monophosphate kinase [Methanoregulaceae archaeon PtaB.Bin152]|nr:MAG: thiamine monophosphate kinase [Methanoregulaceae archaeon PtaB.Bin152]
MKIGKIDRHTFSSVILKRLGNEDGRVIVPPAPGIDAGVIDIGQGKVLLVAEDPIFAIPGQPLEMFGWYTVHIGASDIAVMGVKPQFMTYSLLMPPEFSKEDFMTVVDSIDRAARDLGIAIVGGHTGHYPGFAAPTIGGITVFAISERDGYVTPAGARPGDEVILTKGPAIETAGILSVMRGADLRAVYPDTLVDRAQRLTYRMTVVDDALTAFASGGVTAMHDATEGGVIGALYEIAEASGVGMKIEESRFIYPPEVEMVCEYFGIDPVAAIAEGSLLITAGPGFSGRIINNLEKAGIPASVIGVVTGNPEERWLIRKNGRKERLAMPEQDPFWPVFFESVMGNA